MKTTKSIIPIAVPSLSGNEKKYVNQALSSTWISSQGEYINKFETLFAKFIQSRYAVSTSNGTSALHLALSALGIGKGDEVIVPDLTFIATINAVTYCGGKPVLADVDKFSLCISPSEIEKLITKKTKAIIPVHLYGNPADMEKILRIAAYNKLFVIEDAAEAHGARVKLDNIWKKVGSLGNLGCFSFFGNKIITTGEGGMVTTDDKKLAEKMKILRDHGQDPDKHYFHPYVGFNYRMTNLQAAIGLAQLERIDALLRFKMNLSSLYKRFLKDIPGITFPELNYEADPVCWLFTMLVDKPFKLNRKELIDKLKKKGVDSRPFFVPLHEQPNYVSKRDFNNAEYLSLHGLNLPSGYNLKENDIKYICGIISQ